MPTIEQRLDDIRRRIDVAAKDSNRDLSNIRLLAVSKTRPVSDIRRAVACGQRDFGESYLQEALPKIEQLAAASLCWHYIGPVQTNKTRAIAEHFDWVHSVDRLKVARRLGEQRPAELPALNICLQVNISREESKSGLLPEDVADCARQIAKFDRLRLRGLMAIPKATADVAQQRAQFASLRQLLQSLQSSIPALDTLSMGMSGDMEAAITEGATWLRIGTGIFGPRLSQ